jgi:hypothetical protein
VVTVSPGPAPIAALPELVLAAPGPANASDPLLGVRGVNESAPVERMPGAALFGPSFVGSGHGSYPGAALAAVGRPAPGGLGTGLSASAGTSSGGGFSPSFFLTLLCALAGLLARLLSERLRLPSVFWRPAAFVSLLERPG